ncbi:Uncharacterized protein conserved in bacteria (DUF2325) [Delftia tsuruhatensis]|uniref:DUF2325 domain-containing protein n=1 Tax=Delftia tsuruhatensis TaxID=180282 RepID=UPI001E6BCB02|nr:DUF2325 domain-containing protein [Delftia tsuruhatensis]CAB5669014.1 Uncharacterized protein conserved in bacteria (DUF2325) [Delftia tsuruhatensis]CAC9682709.1 Uncharacterized protein conserved in bacteria (DUF2325) [Delftia tsuruhatensis]
MTQTLEDIQQLAHEHQVLLRGYGHAQSRSSELLCLQAQEIEKLQRQLLRQRAALISKETQLMWAREDRDALELAIPGLSRRVTLARRVESLLLRVQDLLRERARWQRQSAQLPLPAAAQAGPQECEDDQAFEASLREADLVICQTGCLSHGDYWRVQDHCQRTGKACVLVEQPDALRIVRIHRGAGGAQGSAMTMTHGDTTA